MAVFSTQTSTCSQRPHTVAVQATLLYLQNGLYPSEPGAKMKLSLRGGICQYPVTVMRQGTNSADRLQQVTVRKVGKEQAWP